MFERFTKPARAMVTNAQAMAVATTSSEIRPEHLLMALLDDESSLAVAVLTGLGTPVEEARRTLEEYRIRYVDGLDDDDAAALRAIGIDLDEVVRRIDESLGGLGGPVRRQGHIPFARSAKKALALALREAIHLGHSDIGTEHILLALVGCGDRVVTDTFEELGLKQRALRDAVREATRRAG